MSTKKRMFDTKFWSDVWVVEELNPIDRYVFFYFMTNEHTTLSGTYQLSLRTAANETGIEREELQRMLQRLYPRIVAKDGWVIVSNALKHQNYRSPKIEPVILAELAKLPKPLLGYVNMPEDFAMERGSDLRLAYMVSKKRDTVSVQYQHLDLDSNLNLDLDSKQHSVAKATRMDQVDMVMVEKADIKPMVSEVERVPSKTIDAMLDYWQAQVGYKITSKVKQNREYCGKLVKEYTKQEIAQMIHAAALASEDQYAPGVADFIDLYRKFDKLKLWAKKKGTNRAAAQF